jgi:hypothetical protein
VSLMRGLEGFSHCGSTRFKTHNRPASAGIAGGFLLTAYSDVIHLTYNRATRRSALGPRAKSLRKNVCSTIARDKRRSVYDPPLS